MAGGARGFEPVQNAPGLWLTDEDLDTYFSCPGDDCSTVNSSIARFCRACGRAIDFEDSFADALARSGMNGPLKPSSDPVRTELTRFGANGISDATRHRGMLLVCTEGGGLLVTNACKPRSTMLRQVLAGDSVYGVYPCPDDLSSAFVVAESGVYKLSFLPEIQTPERIPVEVVGLVEDAHSPIVHFTGEHALLIQPLGPEGPTRITRLTSGGGGAASVQIPGLAGRPVGLGDDRIFLNNTHACFVIEAGTLEYSEYPNNDELDTSTAFMDPVHIHGKVIVPARHDLRIFDPSTGVLSRFGPDVLEPYLLARDDAARWVVIADSAGLKTVDGRTGRLLGDSHERFGFRVEQEGVPPVVTDASVVLVGRGFSGSTQVLSLPLEPNGQFDSMLHVQQLYTVGLLAVALVLAPGALLVAEDMMNGCALTRVGVTP